jgi:hypothetical protein
MKAYLLVFIVTPIESIVQYCISEPLLLPTFSKQSWGWVLLVLLNVLLSSQFAAGCTSCYTLV